MLKIWNIVLIILTFNLCIFGTFITRSGIIGSVHSFGQDPFLGGIFLAFLGVSLPLTFRQWCPGGFFPTQSSPGTPLWLNPPNRCQ